MRFHATGKLLQVFENEFKEVKKEEYKDENDSQKEYIINNKQMIIKNTLKLNLNKLSNIYHKFTGTKTLPSFIHFDLIETKKGLDYNEFPSLKSNYNKYIKYKNKYLGLKALL